MNALVTGGATGLGASIVRKLAAEMAGKVYFTYAKSAEAAALLEAEYKNATAIHCDFTAEESVGKFVGEISRMDIDVLVNNANTSLPKEHFHKSDYRVFRDEFEHNVLPVLRITQEILKCFRKKKSGKIINIISSAVVNKPPIGWSAYTADKAYLLAMSKSWAVENIGFNITSNSISPSFMQTSLTSDTDERLVEQMVSSHPLKRLLSPDEVAESVMFFINAGPHVNGVNLVINAGDSIA